MTSHTTSPSSFPSSFMQHFASLSPRARQALEARGQALSTDRFLLVDFYRIRRRVALALPLITIPSLPPKVGAIEQYPWMLWIIFKLESRLLSLAVAAQSDPGGPVAEVFERDLRALCQWSTESIVATGQPLFGAHLLRSLTYLLDLPSASRACIESSISGILTGYRAILDDRWAVLRQEEKTGDTWPKPCYNINCIPIFAMAQAARRINHPWLGEIEDLASQTAASLAAARRIGWTEGWSYDAFVQDFLADWLLASPQHFSADLYAALRPSLLEPFQINLPGPSFRPPILADSECPEMFFHWSAPAKWFALSGDRSLLPGLKSADLADVSSDALLWWPAEEATAASAPSPLASPNAIILRTEGASPLIVTAGAARCQNGHLHADRAHVCLGSERGWIVQDPGYRQYLRTSEHHFATGLTSHNAPVIEDQPESLEGVRVIPLVWPAPLLDATHNSATFQLVSFYPPALELTAVNRTISLGDSLLIEDTIAGARPTYPVSYFWHFHPEAFLGETDGALLVVLHDEAWSIRCSQQTLSLAQVSRLRGSRGQQTLQAHFPATAGQPIRWAFTRL